MTVLNPWQWYCSTRTFSNSLETTLTIAALSYWPWELLADAKVEKNVSLQGKGRVTRYGLWRHGMHRSQDELTMLAYVSLLSSQPLPYC